MSDTRHHRDRRDPRPERLYAWLYERRRRRAARRALRRIVARYPVRP